ncbi:hypothetical protein KM043_016560 [Ampulex compressa]|nr:hypothetical protein KM043_016560 [Ampulex compressa]
MCSCRGTKVFKSSFNYPGQRVSSSFSSPSLLTRGMALSCIEQFQLNIKKDKVRLTQYEAKLRTNVSRTQIVCRQRGRKGGAVQDIT